MIFWEFKKIKGHVFSRELKNSDPYMYVYSKKDKLREFYYRWRISHHPPFYGPNSDIHIYSRHMQIGQRNHNINI